MTIWVDAQLPPAIATWITSTFEVTALALRDMGLRDAEDYQIRLLYQLRAVEKESHATTALAHRLAW